MTTHKLTIRANDREQAIAVYRYIQKVFGVKKEDVGRVDDSTFTVWVRKDVGVFMMNALRDKFEGQ